MSSPTCLRQKRGRGTWFGLILDSGAQNVFEGRRGSEMVIEEEPEADGEPDIKVLELLEASTPQPQPTRPETPCQEGLPEVSITS